MNLRELIRSIRKKVSQPGQLSDEMVLGFLRVLERVDREDITCEELYLKLDEEYEALLHVVQAAEDDITRR